MVPGLCSLGLQGSATAGNSGYKRGNDEVRPHSAPQLSSGCLGLCPVPAAGAAPAAAPLGAVLGPAPSRCSGSSPRGCPRLGLTPGAVRSRQGCEQSREPGGTAGTRRPHVGRRRHGRRRQEGPGGRREGRAQPSFKSPRWGGLVSASPRCPHGPRGAAGCAGAGGPGGPGARRGPRL